MRPLSLRLRNFRSHADTTVKFPDGCVSIVGANGAGKSSILAGLEVALFGPEGRSLAPYLRTGGTRMVLELTFEHGGDTYRVRRELLNGKTVLDFAIEGPGWHIEPDRDDEPIQVQSYPEFETLTAETTATTQERIEKILGFSRRTLRASSLLMQADAGAFVDADPKARKEILAEVLGLDLYGRLIDLVRGDRRALETEISTAEGSVGVLRETAAFLDTGRAHHAELTAAALQITEELGTLRAGLAEAQHAHDRIEKQAAAHAQLTRDVAQAEQTCADYRRRDLEHHQIRGRLVEARDVLPTLEERAAEHAWLTGHLAGFEEASRTRVTALKERERMETDISQIQMRAASLSHARDGIDAKIAAASDTEHAATCDRCGGLLDDESRAVAVASLDQEKAAITTEVDSLKERADLIVSEMNALVIPDAPDGLEQARDRMTTLTNAPVNLATAKARVEELEQQISPEKLAAFQVELDHAEAALVEAEKALAVSPPAATDTLANLVQSIAQVESRIATLEAQERDTADKLSRASERITTAENAAERLAEIEATTSIHRAKVGLLEQLERAYGPNGIPMLLMENHAIPHIETEANRVLVALGGQPAGWRIELRTQAEKKTGGLKDALDVVVHTGPGEERDYRSLSGGERTRVAVALRLGVARLLAHRAGADCQLLALDEPDALDTAGKAALVDVLHELAGTYRTVLLISHDVDLLDRFDTVWQVELDSEGRSQLAGEKVAA